MQNKRGQFYLIAAIVIIAIAAGYVTISNHASSTQNKDIYYLRDEIRIESARTMDYAASTGANFKTTMMNLSEQYTNNTFGDNFYFIFGTGTASTFLSYQSYNATIAFNGADRTGIIGTGKVYIEDFTPVSNQANVSINGNNYIFNLAAGNNYRFIISNNKGGNYTVTG
ncbi:MAG TPA: hypothetical protein VMC07_01475 [Candidatus Omnitrophota bacterium]|nr:hypothetical protein [Candidatus Omnitrophota bacterium]